MQSDRSFPNLDEGTSAKRPERTIADFALPHNFLPNHRAVTREVAFGQQGIGLGESEPTRALRVRRRFTLSDIRGERERIVIHLAAVPPNEKADYQGVV